MPSWSTGINLRGSPGVAGLSVLTGTGSPASTLGAQGQAYIDTAAGVLYQKGASAWGTGTPLTGPQGLSVLTGSGAPASTLGVQGQAYIDTTAGVLYAKGASAWNAGLSLVGPPGTGGGGSSNAPQLRFGSGPPTSTNPSIQNDGDGFIDGQASALYGPRANGAWPSTPQNLIGPTGPAGLSVLSSQSVGCGRDFFSTDAVSTTAVIGKIPGTAQAAVFAPPFATSFMGLTYTNINGNLTVTLQNITTNTPVWSGTLTGNLTGNTGAQFAIGQYPMPANNQYQWLITSASAATAALWAQPLYLWPAAAPAYNVSQIGTAGVINANMTASPTLKVGSSTIAQSFRFIKAAQFFSVTVNNPNAYAASANLIQNSGNSPTVFSVTAPPNAVTTFGPYALGTYPLAANTQYYWNTYGAGTGSLFVDASIAFSVA